MTSYEREKNKIHKTDDPRITSREKKKTVKI